MKAPCETIVWYLLPAMRAEIAKELVNENLTRSEIADKLGVSKAAVCQYVNKKRGAETALEQKSKKEIKLFAKKIVSEGITEEEVAKGICILCGKLRKNLMESEMSECPKQSD